MNETTFNGIRFPLGHSLHTREGLKAVLLDLIGQYEKFTKLESIDPSYLGDTNEKLFRARMKKNASKLKISLAILNSKGYTVADNFRVNDLLTSVKENPYILL